jgi:hypothetical protein
MERHKYHSEKKRERSYHRRPGRPYRAELPPELMALDKWCLWRFEWRESKSGKWTKVPYQPNGRRAESDNRALAQLLSRHRERQGNPETGPIFRTSKGTALDPNNLLHDQILPALNRCATCKRSEKKHAANVGHEYRRDQSIPLWHGWHAFRRGLATNLHRLGVQDKTIQAILRYSNVAVTQACYIKAASQDSVRAMAALDSVLCSTCALESTVPAGPQV